MFLVRNSKMFAEKKRVPLLRPNPNFEEDLAWATEIEPSHLEKIQSYPPKKKKKIKDPCVCAKPRASGEAPRLTLNNGKKIPAVAIGACFGYAADTRPIPFREGLVATAIEWAIDVGYRHIDTAAKYNNEQEVGLAIANKIQEHVVTRNELFITTKLWNDCHKKEEVIPALRESLERLDLKYVDLYLMHWPIAETADGILSSTDYVETWYGMIEAFNRGLARSIGVCNFNERQIDRILALSYHRPAVLQTEINLTLQQPELLAYCRSQNIMVMGHSPFGSLNTLRGCDDSPLQFDNPTLVDIAAEYRKNVDQLALRYVLELGVIPVPELYTKGTVQRSIDLFDFELSRRERKVLKGFDTNYRPSAAYLAHWVYSPYFPFK